MWPVTRAVADTGGLEQTDDYFDVICHKQLKKSNSVCALHVSWHSHINLALHVPWHSHINLALHVSWHSHTNLALHVPWHSHTNLALHVSWHSHIILLRWVSAKIAVANLTSSDLIRLYTIQGFEIGDNLHVSYDNLHVSYVNLHVS
jgi:hypothetical protein